MGISHCFCGSSHTSQFPRLQLNVHKTLLSLCCKPSKTDLFFWYYSCWTFAFMILANYYRPLYFPLFSLSFNPQNTHTWKKSERCLPPTPHPPASTAEHTRRAVNIALSFSMTVCQEVPTVNKMMGVLLAWFCPAAWASLFLFGSPAFWVRVGNGENRFSINESDFVHVKRTYVRRQQNWRRYCLHTASPRTATVNLARDSPRTVQ